MVNLRFLRLNSITHSTIFLLIIKLMKNCRYITLFDISASKDASKFYQYQVSGASEETFYTFLSLEAFSRPESGDNRKKVGKVGPSKIYLQEIKVYMMKIKLIIFFFKTKYGKPSNSSNLLIVQTPKIIEGSQMLSINSTSEIDFRR